MKILFINTLHQDYLADSILIGLKEHNFDIVEFPKNKFIYKKSISEFRNNTSYGRGFTLYNLIDNKYCNNLNNLPEKFDNFDFVIFGSIANQYDLFILIKNKIEKNKIIFLDGEDTGALVPFYGKFWRKNILNNSLHKRYKYFKREINDDTQFYRYYKIFPICISNKFPLHKNIFEINFSIPGFKISDHFLNKTKIFPKHIVDKEVAKNVEGSYTTYAFEDEKSYYNDLQISKFGITMKRSGWDCLRHYEIAANGAVICFKNLHIKPKKCAPHGLVDGINCISYTNYSDLIAKIDKLEDSEYDLMRQESLKWVKQNSCSNIAKNLIKNISPNSIF
jgi:hypothetical protein